MTRHRHAHGWLWQPATVLAIPDEAIGQPRIRWEISELLPQADRPLHLRHFARRIGTNDLSPAAYRVCRAEQAGPMKKIGSCG